jgi:H+-transporting ATP synthase F0 complex subunit s
MKVSEHARTFSSLLAKSDRSAATFEWLIPQRFERRWFWGIDVAFNKVDEERVRLAGPDRAAAEWVLKNGGSIKWTTSSNQLADYNLLPSTGFESYKLEEIDLTATDVIGLGFEHLKDLQDLRKVTLHGVRTIGDDALEHLKYVEDTLEYLDISRCPMITEKGLSVLTEFKKLKHLIIYNLIEIKNLEAVVNSLKKAMPWCTIDTTDTTKVSTSAKEH